MFDFFKKGKVELFSPIRGKCVKLEEVPDKIFAEKMLGDGVAIVPEDNKIYSPVDGVITMVAQTKHAIGIKTKNGMDVMIHVGLDTVNFMGKGFDLKVQQGDRVRQGTLIIEFDKIFFESQGINTITMLIVTNSDDFSINKPLINKNVTEKEILLNCCKK